MQTKAKTKSVTMAVAGLVLGAGLMAGIFMAMDTDKGEKEVKEQANQTEGNKKVNLEKTDLTQTQKEHLAQLIGENTPTITVEVTDVSSLQDLGQKNFVEIGAGANVGDGIWDEDGTSSIASYTEESAVLRGAAIKDDWQGLNDDDSSTVGFQTDMVYTTFGELTGTVSATFDVKKLAGSPTVVLWVHGIDGFPDHIYKSQKINSDGEYTIETDEFTIDDFGMAYANLIFYNEPQTKNQWQGEIVQVTDLSFDVQ